MRRSQPPVRKPWPQCGHGSPLGAEQYVSRLRTGKGCEAFGFACHISLDRDGKEGLYGFQSHWTNQRGDPAGTGFPAAHGEGPPVHGLVSITHVETTPDLRYAKVYVSVLDQSDVKEVIRGLKSAGGYLRRELGRALSLRYTPELVFQADDSIEKGSHILKLLHDVEGQGGQP